MIKGFSKLSKEEKKKFILKQLKSTEEDVFDLTMPSNESVSGLIEDFSENVLSLYPFPYGIAPNFLIDGKEYMVPFVTEESSVVAAAAKSAGYWYSRGGFKTSIIGNIKRGQVHFISSIPYSVLNKKIASWETDLLQAIERIDAKMKERGGGIHTISLVDKTTAIKNYFQIEVGFNTCDAMGANYMNSCLEGIAQKLMDLYLADIQLMDYKLDIIMSILSNYSPENAVKIWVECPVEELSDPKMEMTPEEFANKFVLAVHMAHVDTSRAVTHNKGIYNGIDAVALATGNDWRAIEANGHAFASADGNYSSLSRALIVDGIFKLEATIPLQVGTVGGITSLHPLAKLSMQILDSPGAEELMKIMAAAGLASNFSAVKALVTTGIQKGHMKMHLSNILSTLNASTREKEQAKVFFKDKTVSVAAVEKYIAQLQSDK